MQHVSLSVPLADDERIARLERQLARERKARLDAEAIAERGLRDLYESQQRLALLQRVTEAANNAPDARAAMALALEQVCQSLGMDFGSAYDVDDDQRAARASGVWHAPSPECMFAFIDASRHAAFDAGIGIVGRALAERTLRWATNPHTDLDPPRRIAADRCHLISGCAIPVFMRDRIVAIIEFHARKLITSCDALSGTLQQIAAQLGRVFERDHARSILLHDALHDAMTGLPNRKMLKERSRAAFAGLSGERTGLALLVIDLDGFKAINDRYGHHTGDMVLVEVARRLQDTLSACRRQAGGRSRMRDAMLARIGGDEFVILVTGASGDAAACAIADAIHDVLAAPIALGEDEASVGASIGIALSNATYTAVDDLQRDTDLAMYEAKAHGRGRTVIFSHDLGRTVRERMSLEREIREAIRGNQFILHFQPIFELANPARPSGYEALVRWEHPERGLIEPSRFIPAAEESGLIVFIGDWVLNEACRALARLQNALGEDAPGPFMAINIAPLQFLQPNFADQVRRVLLETGARPHRIKLEVTEGVAIIDADRTRCVLDQIRALGVQTGIDDFGTGYSSLSYLHSLPFDNLKIDRSFVASLHEPRSHKIVSAILELAGKLDLSVVAEGIETVQQGEELAALGCGYGQGFHLGRPLREADAFALLVP